MSIICPKCGGLSPDGARFCEADGEPLTDTPAPSLPTPAAAPDTSALVTPVSAGCTHCNAPAAANVDGWCEACGRRWRTVPAPGGRDHKEILISATFGGVSDRGQRHKQNEDDLALALVARSAPDASPEAILVVCDGVSSSEDAHRASAVAAQTICAELETATPTGDVAEALTAAIAAANAAVNALAPTTPGAATDPPETTVVAATLRDRVATVAWVGDSRAYWIADAGPGEADATPDAVTGSRLLTRDHSWVNDVVESGAMTAEEAGKNRLAHAITRCLGGGSASDPDGSSPSVATFSIPPASAGWLLLCTDGLWNYCDSLDRICGLVDEAEAAVATADATGIARWLVSWANAQGGRDNITVAMVRLGE